MRTQARPLSDTSSNFRWTSTDSIDHDLVWSVCQKILKIVYKFAMHFNSCQLWQKNSVVNSMKRFTDIKMYYVKFRIYSQDFKYIINVV